MDITNECNMQLMARYPDKYFDLAIVDPPYGIGASKQSESNSKIKGRKNSTLIKRSTLKSKEWDNSTPTKEYFEELFRVSKNQIIWGGNYFTENLQITNGWIVWNKLQVLETRSDGELAWTSFKKPLKIVPLLQDGFKRGQNIGYNQPIIYNVPFSGKQTIHPTQKPIVLYKWILDKYAKKGDKILDTHLGSGSIAIACHDYGFDLTACELDKEYYDKAMQRINNHISQQKLF
jgi:site-specific DNA-methyltransferase (adenine-specific)